MRGRGIGRRAGAGALALLAGLLLGAGGDEPPRDEAWWRQHALAVHREAAAARANYEAVLARYTRMRTKWRDRGEPRVEILEQRQAAEERLRRAEERLEALPDEARRAGVPPGWVRVFPEDLESDPG